jgi:drug/metabolite transporter (DMT)-like permease
VSSASRFPLNLPMLVVVLTWGFNFVSLKIVYPEMSPPALMFNRTIVMGLLLAGVCLLRRQSLRYPAGEAPRILFGGFLSLGVYMVIFLEGLALTSPAEAAIMLTTAPVFTYLLSCAFKQDRFQWAALVGSMVCFIGVAFVIVGGADGQTTGSTKGNLMVLASSMVWAFSVIALRPSLTHHDSMRVFTLSLPGALPLAAVYGLLPALGTNYGAISTIAWLNLAQVVFMSGVVAFVLFYVGMNQIGSSRAGMYQFFIPPTTAAYQWLVFGKVLVALQWVGLAFLLGGVIYSSRARAMAARTSA